MKWLELLQSLSPMDFAYLQDCVRVEDARRTGNVCLTAEESKMEKIFAIKSVRNRLGLDLCLSKKYVEAAYELINRG